MNNYLLLDKKRLEIFKGGFVNIYENPDLVVLVDSNKESYWIKFINDNMKSLYPKKFVIENCIREKDTGEILYIQTDIEMITILRDNFLSN